MPRPIYEIAAEVRKDIIDRKWSREAAAYAMPYLNAMRDLSSIKDNYGADSGRSVVLYFLSNAQTWRGETARRIKAELKNLLRESGR